MIADHHVGQGDLEPSIGTTLKDENDIAINLTGYTVAFRMRLVDKSRPAFVGTAVVVNATTGEVRHDRVPGETDVPGLYEVEWPATKLGRQETFSNNNKSALWIAPKV